MCSRFRDHFAIFVKIIITVIGCFIDRIITDIAHLRCCRQFTQIIDHIVSVKFHWLFCIIWIFWAAEFCELHHMWTASLKAATFIMIIKAIQNGSIYFDMIKIMNCCCIVLTSIIFQTVKSITFHQILFRTIIDRTNLCFIRYWKHAACRYWQYPGHSQCHYSQSSCQEFPSSQTVSSFHVFLLFCIFFLMLCSQYFQSLLHLLFNSNWT